MGYDLITGPWEMQVGDLLLGGDDPTYSLVQVEGLKDLPGLRTTDRPRLRRHGLLPGDDFLSGRSVVVTLEVWADTDADLTTAMDALAEALVPGGDEDLVGFQFPGVAGGDTRVIIARPRAFSASLDLDWLYGIPTVTFRLDATDPRIYAAAASAETSVLPSAGGGLNFDAVAPFTFGAVSTGGTITAVNEGNFPTSPFVRIDGPVVGPRIEHLGSGRVLELSSNLASGEWLDLDFDARTVLLNGTSSRYSELTTSEWFDLEPGSNEVTFRASTSTSATMTLTWRSAWV